MVLIVSHPPRRRRRPDGRTVLIVSMILLGAFALGIGLAAATEEPEPDQVTVEITDWQPCRCGWEIRL